MRTKALLKIKNVAITALIDVLVVKTNFFCYANRIQIALIILMITFTVYSILWNADEELLRRRVHGRTRKGI